jgi:DNA-binding FadR family transcriptional regulator
MKLAQKIFIWLDAVKADRRLRGSCFHVAYQLTRKISNAEHEKSGTLVTWQSERTIANALGLSERTVRDMVHLLRDTDYVDIETGHGPGSSNRYTLKDP